MSLIKNLLLILFFGCFENATSQPLEGTIPWKEGVFLSWNDFKAKPPQNSNFKANTNAGISFSWGLRKENGNENLSYEVKSFFFPELSWVVAGAKTDHLLQHEQTHFDITELYVRKFRKGLSEFVLKGSYENVHEILNDLYNLIEKERSLMQKEYDQQTNHSLNKEADIKWQKLVRKELFKLRNFRN